MKNPTSKPKETQFKVWVAEEAERLQVKESTIIMRYYRGKYSHLKLRRESNPRLVWVQILESEESVLPK